MLHAGDAADLEFHVATVLEGQEEHLSVEECAFGHIGHVVQAAFVEPVLAVDQRTVGLPDVIDGQFGTVALAYHPDELAPAGGVEHRAVVPASLRGRDGQGVLGIALFTQHGVGGKLHFLLGGIGEVDVVGHVVEVADVVH